MWPFKKKVSDAGRSMEWLPRAIDVAAEKWMQFESQPFAADMPLNEKLFRFSEGLGRGLRQWQGLNDLKDDIVFLIAAKGAEKSRTHLRIEIETAVGFPLPTPHERTDEEENRILMSRIVDRARRKWLYFNETIKFDDTTTLHEKIEMFQIPFIQGLRQDFPMLCEAPDHFLQQMTVLGILDTKTLSLEDTEIALNLAS